MQQEDALKRIKNIVFETFGVPVSNLTGQTSAKDVPGWDSLGHLVFITGIEREFGTKLPMEASLSVPDLDALATLVRQNASA